MELLELMIFIGLDFLLVIFTLRTSNWIYAIVGASILVYEIIARAGDGTLTLYSTLDPSTGLYVPNNVSISPILVLLGLLAIMSFYVSMKEGGLIKF